MAIAKSPLWCLALFLGVGVCLADPAPDIALSLRTIRAVGPEGQGNAEASALWKKLAAGDATIIPEILAAMDGANDLSANWLRAAIDAIAERQQRSGGKLPLLELGNFLLDARHNPSARRLAFELIGRSDPATAENLRPGLMNDPGGELRRDGVQRAIDQAGRSLAESNRLSAVLLYQQALTFARDVDQVETIAKQLRGLGQRVDLPVLFGWLTRWKVIGPFDSAGGKGFAAVYPPEKEMDLAAEYEGKSGKAGWKDLETADEYGVVDINKPYTALKGVAAYAHAEFTSDKEQAVELRLGSQNSWKIWLNGQFLFGREEYHRGREIDQYRIPATLRAGRNSILVKVCQNEQKDDWAGEWQFQMRICDPFGAPVFSRKPEAGERAQINREAPGETAISGKAGGLKR